MKAIDELNMKIASLTKFLTLFLTLIVVYGVLCRYFFRAPDIRTFFLSNWLYGIVFLLGCAYTLQIKGHIVVDVLYIRLSPKVKKAFDLLNLFTYLLFCSIMIPTSISLAWYSYSINELDSTMVFFSPPIWWYKWFIVISLILTALQVFSEIPKVIRGK